MKQLSAGLTPLSRVGAPEPLTAYLSRKMTQRSPQGQTLDVDFTALPSGPANGAAGLRAVSGSANLAPGGLTVDALFSGAWEGTQMTVPDMRGGELDIVPGDGPYMVGVRDAVGGWQLTLWSAGGTFGNNDEFGFIRAGAVRPRGALPIPQGRRRLSLKLPATMAYGETVEVRRWLDGSPRPDAPTATFVIGQQADGGADPTDLGAMGLVAFNSIGSPAIVRSVRFAPQEQPRPEIETQALATAAWVPRRLEGRDYLACIAQGNELLSWVSNTLQAGWVVTTPAGADYASRVALYVDGALDSIRDCPIGAEGTLTVNLPDTGRHLISLVVSGTHEGGGDTKLWDGIHGVYVRRLDVGSGSADPPAEGRRQVLAISDSTGAAIVARGHARNGPVSQPRQSAGELGWPLILGRTLGAAVTCCCWGGQGILRGGNGGVPAAPNALGFAMRGEALRWRSGLPTDIVIGHGANDVNLDSAELRNAYRAYIAQIRATYPLAQVYLLLPFAGQQEAAIRQVAADTGCLVWMAETMSFVDGTHPDTASLPRAGTQTAGRLRQARGEGFWEGGETLPPPRFPLVLVNGWQPREGAPAPLVYRQDGRVHVQMVVSNTTGDSIITVLPEGYRPSGEIVVYAPSVEGSVLVAIRASGEIQQYGGTGPSTRLTILMSFSLT